MPASEIIPENPSSSDLDHLIPKLARNEVALKEIERRVNRISTHHELILGDARDLGKVPDGSVQLVLTSPPYWTLKEYNDVPGQLGGVNDYDIFLEQLDRCWSECYRILVPSGRLVVVVGDVLLSRRKHKRHQVIPLHADIQIRCRKLGFDNLAPVFWYKIASAAYEANGNGKGFLGKPYEPDANRQTRC